MLAKRASTILPVTDDVLDDPEFSTCVLPSLRESALENFGRMGAVVESTVTCDVRRRNEFNPGDYGLDGLLLGYGLVRFTAMVVPNI